MAASALRQTGWADTILGHFMHPLLNRPIFKRMKGDDAYTPSGIQVFHRMVKKLLQPGNRGHKDTLTDLREALASIQRAIQIEEQSQ